jgi:alpha-tubulin suppressor-like RCC1 family protein
MGSVSLVPMQVDYFQKINSKVVSVALGEAHTLVLDKDGNVFSFGWGELG